MLRSLGYTLLLTIPLAAGCGEPNAGAMFAELEYATRCEATLGCEGARDREVCGFNRSDPCTMGAEEATLSCNVTEAASTRTLSFSARQGRPSISVDNVSVARAGGTAISDGGCRVRVTDGVNTYVGVCGGMEPSAAQPCRVSGIRFYDDVGNPTFTGEIFCRFLPNQATPGLQIEVTAAGSGPGPASRPGSFRFANCPGLTLDE